MLELTGKRLGQYLILEQIGKGGMATVFKAEQTSLGRVVAVKVLPINFQNDETFRRRFAQEARAVARMNHPHILPVYDFGETDEVAYIVMEYVSGGTLQGKMGAPLRPDYTAKIVGQIGSALDYAHECGVVHRDVKPANIMLRADGTSLLADFGLAKLAESGHQLTRSGVGMGTPEYMSPEQAKGSKVDWRSDLYSLGVVMYEMLTGRIPYEADTPLAVAVKHISEPPPRACASNPHLPPAVDEILLKALAKRPEDRYQKGSDLADALAQTEHGDLRLSGPTASPALPVPVAPPGPLAVPPDRSVLRRAGQDAMPLGLSAALLLYLALGPSPMPIIAALLISGVAYVGLSLIIPSGPPEDPNRKEVRRLLEQSIASAAHLRATAAAAGNQALREEVERIAGEAAHSVRKAIVENAPLSETNHLANILGLMSEIVDLCVGIGERSGKQGKAIVEEALRTCLEYFAASEEEGIGADIAKLLAALEMLKKLMEMEGLARSSREASDRPAR